MSRREPGQYGSLGAELKWPAARGGEAAMTHGHNQTIRLTYGCGRCLQEFDCAEARDAHMGLCQRCATLLAALEQAGEALELYPPDVDGALEAIRVAKEGK